MSGKAFGDVKLSKGARPFIPEKGSVHSSSHGPHACRHWLVGGWMGLVEKSVSEKMCCGRHSDKGAKTLSDKYVQQRAVVPCVSAKSGRTVSVGKYGGKYVLGVSE